MANGTVRPYMNKRVFDELITIYPNKEESLNRSVTAFLLLRKISLRELKGIFSKNELTGILASFNGTIIDFSIGIPPADLLRIQIEDSIDLENNDSMYQYDAIDLLMRLNLLDNLKAMFLLEEIYRFWNVLEEQDLDKFLEKY